MERRDGLGGCACAAQCGTARPRVDGAYAVAMVTFEGARSICIKFIPVMGRRTLTPESRQPDPTMQVVPSSYVKT